MILISFSLLDLEERARILIFQASTLISCKDQSSRCSSKEHINIRLIANSRTAKLSSCCLQGFHIASNPENLAKPEVWRKTIKQYKSDLCL